MERIVNTELGVIREPLRAPFGFKGGTLSELWGICIPYNMLDDTHVQICHDHDITVICTPADTPEQVARAMHYQTTLPLCNDPRAYLRAAGRL